MSIVKDLMLPVLFFCVVMYCFNLKRCLIFQKKTFSEIMKHDLKIPLLAQKRALDLVNCGESELLSEIKNSSDEILSMVETVINSYEDYENNELEKINLSEFVISVFEDLFLPADRKNIDFYMDIDNDVEIIENIIEFKNFLKYTLISLIEDCPRDGKIGFFCRQFDRSLEIKIAGNISDNKKNDKLYKGKISTVGHTIRNLFCKNFIKKRGWSCIEKTAANNVKTFTIHIPILKEFRMSQDQIQTLLQ